MLISELAAATHETPRTIRFYEAKGLLAEPPRTPTNYRDYPPTAIDDVRSIRTLQAAGLTLDEIADLVELRQSHEALATSDLTLLETTMNRIDDCLASLHRMRRRFATFALDEDLRQCVHGAGSEGADAF